MGSQRVSRPACLLLLVMLGACSSSSRGRQEPAAPDSALRAELVRLGVEDQAVREGFGSAMASNDSAFAMRMVRTDSARTTRLRQIVAEHGWPGRALAGDDGAKAAWLILQHSPSTEFQQEMLPVLWQAAERGDIDKASVAMLTDRVLVKEGKAQRYGSSFGMQNGRLEAHRIEDFAGLDARRAAVGLPPMQEYVDTLRVVYRLPVTWPPTP